jgi:hypothetical protein
MSCTPPRTLDRLQPSHLIRYFWLNGPPHGRSYLYGLRDGHSISRTIGTVVEWTLLILAFLIVVAIVIAIVVGIIKGGNGGSRKPVHVTGRVDGVFARTGCLGCGQVTAKILTSHVYCGWHKGRVIVHVTMKNTSSEKVTVHWHPSYAIVNRKIHGGGPRWVHDTRLQPRQSKSVFVGQSPKGVVAGTSIARCDPSFLRLSSR